MTTRLVDSPAFAWWSEEGDMSATLRAGTQAGRARSPRRPADSEVNPDHALVKRLDASKLRRPGEHPSSSAACRGRTARRSGGLRQARQRAAGQSAQRRARAPERGSSDRRRSGPMPATQASGRRAQRRLGPRPDLLVELRTGLLVPVGAPSATEGDRKAGRSSAVRSRHCGGSCAACAAARREAQFAPVELHEVLVAREHGTELARHACGRRRAASTDPGPPGR